MQACYGTPLRCIKKIYSNGLFSANRPFGYVIAALACEMLLQYRQLAAATRLHLKSCSTWHNAEAGAGSHQFVNRFTVICEYFCFCFF